MNIGRMLRDLRTKTGKTLQEQSEIFGVSVNTVYRWEHNLVKPQRARLKEIAGYYGVPLEQFLEETIVNKGDERGDVAFPDNNAE